jgi:tight adherence protein C
MFLLLIGVLFSAVSIVLVARAVALPRLRTEAGLAQIGAYGFPEGTAAPDSRAPVTDALDRLAERLGAAMLPRVKREDQDEVRALLVSAGAYETTPGRFLGYRIIAAVAFTATWVWFGPAAGLPPAIFLLSVPLLGLCGWTVPLSLLRVRSHRRLERIDNQLPELVDSLVVTVEAGVGFGAALRMAGQKLGGPLGEEIQLTLQEQNMGLATEAALQNLLTRVELPSMRSFVRAVLQGETLGVSIGEIMRSLAVEMRDRRRAKAEERAQKAPVKMLFPLTFCIFPAIMIVLLYPAITEFGKALGN